MEDTSRRVQESCAEAMATVRACKGEAQCAQAAVGLTLCMAKLLCKEEVRGTAVVLIRISSQPSDS